MAEIYSVQSQWLWATELGKLINCKQWQFWRHWLELLISRVNVKVQTQRLENTQRRDTIESIYEVIDDPHQGQL